MVGLNKCGFTPYDIFGFLAHPPIFHCFLGVFTQMTFWLFLGPPSQLTFQKVVNRFFLDKTIQSVFFGENVQIGQKRHKPSSQKKPKNEKKRTKNKFAQAPDSSAVSCVGPL